MPEVGEERGLPAASVDRQGPWLEAVGRGFVGQGCQQARARATSLTHDLQTLKGLLCARCLLSHGFTCPCPLLQGVQPCNSQLASGWGMLLRSLWGCGGILGWGTMPLGTRANQGLLPSIHRNHIGW